MEPNRPQAPTELYCELDLLEKTNNDPRLPEHRLKMFEERKIGFDWVHMGTSALTVGRLLKLIKTTRYLSAPRTGHFGNWEDIAKGRAGMLDYNKAICGTRNLGYPLILDFNQTEDATLESGDWIYMPGSIVSKGERKPLRILSWNGTEFTERGRQGSYFTPLVMTATSEGLVPLTELHRRQMDRLSLFKFRYQSAFLQQHETTMAEIFHELIDAARVEGDHRALYRIVDRFVFKDGRVSRGTIEFRGQGFMFQDVTYADTAELVAAAMLPFKAAVEPASFFAEIKNLPEAMPLASAPMVGALLAMFNSHYPDVPLQRETMTLPCNPHFHWGALGMAGYPPKNRGYFFTNVSKSRKLHQAIVQRFSYLDPVFFVLLPAAIFSLFPSSAHPGDKDLVGGLIARVHERTAGLIHKSNLLAPEIEKCVNEWVVESSPLLSRYFVDRFRKRRSVLTSQFSPEFSEPVEPERFQELTLQQASMMVGILHEAIGDA